MDDLFAAFDAPAASKAVLAQSLESSHKGASGAQLLNAAESLPAAGRKRRRQETDNATESVEAQPAAVTRQPDEDVSRGSKQSRKAQAHDVGDAIDAAAVLDIDPKRKEEVVDFAVEPPSDEEDGKGNNAAAQKAATYTQKLDSKTTGIGAALVASTDLVNTTTARLPRGEVDEGKTTAPSEAEADAGAAARKAAKTYPFTLDPFQKRSIECLERNESVLVSAHTSAGKTVVAEYAIAMALRDKQRVIYTSPIKALSNQKYRDLFEEFSDVGLMTGDVTINPNASCLVMTTEILRSMLYRGSEVMREVKWVIFDEIHYMRDKERGVVWEESIIMLPHKVRFVFLSATIPNSKEFAEWVAKIHHQTCHVVYTDYRPTPLQHFVFPAGGEGVYLVVDEKGRFREDNFTKAMAALGTTSLADAVDDVVNKGAGKKNAAKSMGKGKGGPSDLYRVIKMVMERNYDPVIVFSFAKRECEQYALQIAKLDLTTADEKKFIEQVFVNAIDSLSEDDKKLPQIQSILPLLKRGIGIHHGGLLPILKEVIEILFQESLLKVLFATETFSMGINMPARTVVFTASRKFDGTDFRWISAGEYIQMSGRAGRRGLDDRGIVIQMIDEKMEPAAAKDILKGTADPLNSAFHLGYNMLLNLMRIEDADPERMMQLSFHQFQNEKAAPAMEAEQARIEAEVETMVIKDEEAVSAYYELCAGMEEIADKMAKFITAPQYCLPFLKPGRPVRIRDRGVDWGWGVVANFQKRSDVSNVVGGDAVQDSGEQQYVLDVLLACSDEPVTKSRVVKPLSPLDAKAGKGELKVVQVLLSTVSAISSIRLYLPKDLKPKDARDTVWERLREVERRFPQGLTLLDPIEDMRIQEPEFKDLLAKTELLQRNIQESPIHNSPDRDAALEAYKEKVSSVGKIKFLKDKIKACHSLVMRDTLRKMKRVLRRLGHINADNVVQTKGRVACEINTADELLCTELIFNGVFNELDAAQAAALLSCLVYTEKGEDEAAPLREELGAPLRQLQDAARRIAQVSQDCKIEIDTEDYVASFRPGMMELVYAWVNGAKFVDVCAMTKEFEGTIIRVIRRLEELCRQLGDASKAVGDENLERKFKDASVKMRRDIIFAASLYL